MQSNLIKNIQKRCKKCKKKCSFFDTKQRKEYNSLPDTDKIIINILDNGPGIDVIYKIIDDIVEYLTSEIGFSTNGFIVLYDDNDGNPDRYSEFF